MANSRGNYNNNWCAVGCVDVGRSGDVNIDNYPITTECPYCKSDVIKTTNDKIYGKIYGNGMVYMCINADCDSYVGCHSDGSPLGRVSDKKLREAKKICHEKFDKIWKAGIMSRSDAYGLLAIKLDINKCKCHFAWFDIKMLRKAYKGIAELEKRKKWEW